MRLPTIGTRRAVGAVLLITVNVAAFTLAMVVSELYLRATHGPDACLRVDPGERPDRELVPWARPDPELGWVSRSTERDINPQGFRDPHDFDAVAGWEGRGTIMILGDSFIWGSGLERDETVTAMLAATLPGVDVFNVSVPGWGVDQMVLAYERYRDRLHPTVVVLAFIDDDINRLLEAYRVPEGMNKPSFVLRAGRLVPRGRESVRGGMLAAAVEHSTFARCVLREIDRATTARAIARALFARLVAATQARHERLVVLRIPQREVLRGRMARAVWHQRSFGDALTGTDMRYLEALAPFEQSRLTTGGLYQADGHTTAAGNAVLARVLADEVGSEVLR